MGATGRRGGWACSDTVAGSDAELLLATRSGDSDAVAALYIRYQGKALGFARSLVHNEHDAADVMHEAFTNTLSAVLNGRGPTDNFLAYLHTAVRSTASVWWSKKIREQPVDSFAPDPVSEPGFDRILDRDEHNRVIAAFNTLPAHWQRVLWCMDVLEQPPRIVGPLMGMSPNAASALLRRARNGLRIACHRQETLSNLNRT